MLAILGDIHGSVRALVQACHRAHEVGCVALIQVGDFGLFEQNLPEFTALELPLPVYCIDGNHEDFRMLMTHGSCPIPISSCITYVPRGLVLELDGRRVGFLGGAASIDKAWRTPGKNWFPEELVTEPDAKRLVRNGPVDLMVTHVPPQWFITKHFESDPYQKVRMFDVPVTWSDPSADYVEEAWAQLEMPPLYCGHMHRSIKDEQVTLLDIAELIFV